MKKPHRTRHTPDPLVTAAQAMPAAKRAAKYCYTQRALDDGMKRRKFRTEGEEFLYEMTHNPHSSESFKK